MEPEPQPIKKRKYRKKEIQRKTFEIDDSNLRMKSDEWHILFLERLADFEAFDPTLNQSFANNWLSLIQAFGSNDSDNLLVARLEGATAQVKEKTDAVLLQLDSLEYFVKKAFPGKARILHEFGFEKMRNANTSGTARFTVNAFTMLKLIPDYEAALLAAGMPASLSSDLETATNQLAESEVEQEYHKRLRLRATGQRIDLFNELYEIYRLVNKAAHIIYRHSPAHAGLFDI